MKLTSVHATPLAYFLEVAERGSLSSASRHLHVAVSAISRQIVRLEEDLGVVLFDRGARGMRLNESGAVVRAYAMMAFLDAEALRAELQGMSELKNSSVRLACSEGFAYDYLPCVIASFQHQHPSIRFSLDVGSAAEVTQKVRAGEVDLALTFSIAAQEGIHIEYSEPAPIHALLSKRHPLASHARVMLADLMPFPLVLITGDNTIRRLFDLVCGLEGLRPNVSLTSNSLAGLQAYLRYGEVIGFCGSLSVRNRLREENWVLVPIGNSEMQQRLLQVQSMAGRRLPPAVRAYTNHLIKDIVGPRRKVRGIR